MQTTINLFAMLLIPPLMVFIMRWLERRFGPARSAGSLYLLLSASWIALGIMGMTVGPPWLSTVWLVQGAVGLVMGIALLCNQKRAYPGGAFLAALGLRAIITSGALPLLSAVLSGGAMLYLAHTARLPEMGFRRPRRAAPVVLAVVVLLMLPFPFQKPTILKMSAGYKMRRMANYSEKVRLGQKTNLEPLINTLNDQDGIVRSRAVEHLGAIAQAHKADEDEYLETIVDVLVPMIDDAETRSAAISQLTITGNARAIRPLIQAIRKYPDMDDYPDKAIFEAFGGFAAQLMIELLEETTGSDQKAVNVRRKIILALGNYRDRRVAGAIAKHLGDENQAVRQAAAESLQNMRKADTVGMLIPDSQPE